MSTLRVIGIDPGPVPGIVCLTYAGSLLRTVEVHQCLADSAADLLRWLLVEDAESHERVLVQVERFVVGRRAARSSSAHAGAVTRDLVGRLVEAAGRPYPALAPAYSPVHVQIRSASDVKPWATDLRLKAVKVHGTDLLAEASSVGRHARDAARHALYAAVKDGGIPDPLSKRSGATRATEEESTS